MQLKQKVNELSYLSNTTMPVEEWRPVDINPDYEVSSLGRVRSKNRFIVSSYKGTPRDIWTLGKLMKPQPHSRGYLMIKLGKWQRNRFIHRLVAAAFLPNPLNKPQVNHKDGNRANNAVDNLEWVTQSENNLHAGRRNAG